MQLKPLKLNLDTANLLLDSLSEMVFIIDLQTQQIVYVNEQAKTLIGRDLEQMNSVGIEGIREGIDEHYTYEKHVERLQEKGFVIEYANVITASKQKIPVEAHAKVFEIDGRLYNLAILRDMTNRLEYQKKLKNLNLHLEEEVAKKTEYLEKNIAFLKSYQKVIDESAIVSKSDLNGRITYANDNFCKLTGYSKDEVIGKPHSIVRHPDNKKKTFKQLWATIKAKKTWKGVLKNRKKDGSFYWVDITIMPILDANGDISEYIGVRYDITELIENKRYLEKVATTDILTDFGNRYKLISDIEHFTRPAVALIDIDSFNEINDFYGNEIGDKVIKEFAKKIDSYTQSKQINLYRLHGDQFALLKHKADEEFTAFVEKLNKYLSSTAVDIEGKNVTYQTTATVSFEAKEELIATADMAKKYAKKRRLHFFVFDKALDINKEYENNLKWTMELKKAFSEDRIVPYYQGIYNNNTQQIEKYECLVRMKTQQGEVISPFFFLDVAKKSKQYLELTKRVISHAFEEFAGTKVEFSINMTLADIECLELRMFLYEKIKEYKVYGQLVIELVESEGIDSENEDVVDFLEQMQKYKIQIAIDDFGTGYSNFIYLIKLNANYVKIDGSMIKNIDKDKDSQEIVKTITRFAKSKGMKTVAEFVSSKEVYEKVRSLGIDYSQGFYFDKPKEKVFQ